MESSLEQYIYVFVRQDLPVSEQIVHSNHAVFHMAFELSVPIGVPNIILIGMPDSNSLNRVETKLLHNHISHFCWSDPDTNHGIIAIATIPLNLEQKQALRNYRLWRLVPSSSEKEHQINNLEVGGLIPSSGANSYATDGTPRSCLNKSTAPGS